MKQLIKCHYNYLISKATVISVSIMLIFIILGYVFSIDVFDTDLINAVNKVHNYTQTSIFITKFLIVILAVFIFSYNFLPKNDQYSYLIISGGVKKSDYFLSKVIVLIMFVLVNIIILCIIYLFFGCVFINHFYFNISYIKDYSNIFLIVLIYGLYSILIVQILKNIFSPLISFASLLISEILFEQSKSGLSKLFYILFPIVPNHNEKFYFGYSHLIFVVIVLLLLNTYIFIYKDLS